jgi:glycosyltransferase involved in cell wall biosynthesis
VTFAYWGRRGALTQFALEAGRAALAHKLISATISVSRQNERFDAFLPFGDALFSIDTFESNAGALLGAWRIPGIRKRLAARLQADRTRALIDLMPHVWSPALAPIVRAQGAKYIAVIHDADRHRGDPSAWVREIADRSVDEADLVVTLSQAVAARLVEKGRVSKAKLITLFHPDLSYGAAHRFEAPTQGTPLRLLFLGRILPYKGLSLFLDAVELLRRSDHPIEIGVFGEGPLGSSRARLDKLGAKVVNRWLADEEIAAALRMFHVVVLSHTHASQSGVAATALSAGLPVVAMPVGGLVEQIKDGKTGVLALRPDASSLAHAIERLISNPELYAGICQNIANTAHARSMATFVDACVQAVVKVP